MSMLKIQVLIGCPSSGKSSYAKELMKKEPNVWKRINNDDLRSAIDLGTWTSDNEKLITETRKFLIRESLKRNKNIIIDNVNSNKKHWNDACKLAKESGKDVQVIEKIFYVPLAELIERDSKRVGSAKVGEAVVKKFFKELGGDQLKFSNPKIEIFKATYTGGSMPVMIQDQSLNPCAVFDLDGTMADISHRSPYDASNCINDIPIMHTLNLSQLLYENKYKIFFFSGRDDIYKSMTEEWLNKHFTYEYSLHMREENNKEDDRLLKERFFNTFIKDKYYCKLWVDDRLRIVKWAYETGIPILRCGDPEASF